MSSKMVNDRQRATRVVVEAAFTHADAVGTALDQIIAPPLPGEGSGGMAGVIRRLGQTLASSGAEVVEADRAHEAEKADDAAVRRALEVAIDTTYREVVDFRTGVEAVGGTEALVDAGIVGITPREPIALSRMGRVLIDALPALATMPVARRGLTFDALSYQQPLTDAVGTLDSTQVALRREERERESTLMIKNRVLAAHDMRFLTIGRTLEALFRLAGFEELADRVRPSARRPGYIENDPEAPTTPGDETPAPPDVVAPAPAAV